MEEAVTRFAEKAGAYYDWEAVEAVVKASLDTDNLKNKKGVEHELIIHPQETPTDIKVSPEHGSWKPGWHLSERSRSYVCAHPCPADPKPIVWYNCTRDVFDRYSMDTFFPWQRLKPHIRGAKEDAKRFDNRRKALAGAASGGSIPSDVAMTGDPDQSRVESIHALHESFYASNEEYGGKEVGYWIPPDRPDLDTQKVRAMHRT